MCNGYRAITQDEGAVVEVGDQYKCGSRPWFDLPLGNLGDSYADLLFSEVWQYRRPIAQDEQKAYASDTNVVDVAEKPVEWNGDGLPHAEVECLILGDLSIGAWGLGVIDYIDDLHCVWHWAEDAGRTMHGRTHQMGFRPIQTEQTERDKVIAKMYFDGTGCELEGNEMDDEVAYQVCESLYDADYRLKGKGDE